MKWYVNDSLSNFKFWSYAKESADKLTTRQFDIVEGILETSAPEEGWDETDINNLFWFDFDKVCQWLGYPDEEAFDAGISYEDIEEMEDWLDDYLECPDLPECAKFLGVSEESYIVDDTDDDGEPISYIDQESLADDVRERWQSASLEEKAELYNTVQNARAGRVVQ